MFSLEPITLLVYWDSIKQIGFYQYIFRQGFFQQRIVNDHFAGGLATYSSHLVDGKSVRKDHFEVDALLPGAETQPTRRRKRRFLTTLLDRASVEKRKKYNFNRELGLHNYMKKERERTSRDSIMQKCKECCSKENIIRQ